jgi:hypothetical protein
MEVVSELNTAIKMFVILHVSNWICWSEFEQFDHTHFSMILNFSLQVTALGVSLCPNEHIYRFDAI